MEKGMLLTASPFLFIVVIVGLTQVRFQYLTFGGVP